MTPTGRKAARRSQAREWWARFLSPLRPARAEAAPSPPPGGSGPPPQRRRSSGSATRPGSAPTHWGQASAAEMTPTERKAARRSQAREWSARFLSPLRPARAEAAPSPPSQSALLALASGRGRGRRRRLSETAARCSEWARLARNARLRTRLGAGARPRAIPPPRRGGGTTAPSPARRPKKRHTSAAS